MFPQAISVETRKCVREVMETNIWKIIIKQVQSYIQSVMSLYNTEFNS